ncbi:MAG: phosphotransferase [Desulfarculales bacterium]|jgi:phosphate uptake regulator/aminoglycoside phosphotransferase|nr:phosphotransferase [Desulfarculales bacterium]
MVEGIKENFNFMITEVGAQLARMRTFISSPQLEELDKMMDREAYINNLKVIIENQAYNYIHKTPRLDRHGLDRVRAVIAITQNVERIADICIDVVQQLLYADANDSHLQDEYQDMLDIIEHSFAEILAAFKNNHLAQALRICRVEFVLDDMYKTILEEKINLFDRNHRQKAGDFIISVFIGKYLEEIGDKLLNIGESIIFAVCGQRIKIEQYNALRDTLRKSGYSSKFNNLNFQAIWGSRSGCRIGRLDASREISHEVQKVLYKEGSRKKILLEKEKLEKWEEIYPGLVPKIYGHNDDAERSSLLMEYMSGKGLDEIISIAAWEEVERALWVLCRTLNGLWRKTYTVGQVNIDYMEQLKERLGDIEQIHHDFVRRSALGIGDIAIMPVLNLIEDCRRLQKQIPSPFAVMIHGDFNTNNIIYDYHDKNIKFIDLHRSRFYDYVQDISIFIVSNFRVNVFDRETRLRLRNTIKFMRAWAGQFADHNRDRTMEARMALALSRAFFTSTRFEIDKAFARSMYMRSIYLMEKFRAHQKSGADWTEFHIDDDLFDF